MKNEFLDDEWLKEQLSDEYIHDDDFSVSVVEKIQFNESDNKRSFYLQLTAIAAIICFLFIPELITVFAEGSASISFLGSINDLQKILLIPMEFIGLCVFCLSFILIWSFEDFDLI